MDAKGALVLATNTVVIPIIIISSSSSNNSGLPRVPNLSITKSLGGPWWGFCGFASQGKHPWTLPLATRVREKRNFSDCLMQEEGDPEKWKLPGGKEGREPGTTSTWDGGNGLFHTIYDTVICTEYTSNQVFCNRNSRNDSNNSNNNTIVQPSQGPASGSSSVGIPKEQQQQRRR
ncbi:predicted protein [Histoplasma capsulatum H143]|uniref:Uncharacterized protein n=1 Tax=Ajellomyces capsulatus (strain H143) TaxID=544712 RepID=C6HLC1_AJECH|nr:predicted protein [Histoplasma capsulatum H143]